MLLILLAMAAGPWTRGFDLLPCCGGGSAETSATSAGAACCAPVEPTVATHGCCDGRKAIPLGSAEVEAGADCHCLDATPPLAGVGSPEWPSSAGGLVRTIAPPRPATRPAATGPTGGPTARAPPDWIQPMAAADLGLRHRRLLI